jgi:SAM-dependent methyltransferase
MPMPLDLPPGTIPTDHARQIHAVDALKEYLRAQLDGVELLDLGCGDGRAVDIVRRYQAATYHGIDIADSPEVRSRTRTDANFTVFDGINIPFGDGHFDCVFSCNVLEHVRHPDELMKQVHRTLKPGGVMLASVSFLEPYHSYSIFNFTPYGVYTVLRDAGLRLVWMRPGIDGITLTLRSLSGRKRRFNRWFHTESPVNRLIGLRSRVRRRSVAEQNAIKLGACGHIVFCAVKD